MVLRAILLLLGFCGAMALLVYLFAIYKQAFLFFPIIFFFSNVPIPGIGSPERLFTALILVVFVMMFGIKDQKGIIDLSVFFALSLFALSFAPSISYSPIPLDNTIPALIGRISLVVFLFVIVKNISSRRQINDCIFGLSILIIMIMILTIYAMMKSGDLTVLRENQEEALFFRQGIFKYLIIRNPTLLSRIVLICFPFIFFSFLRRPVNPWRTYYLFVLVACVFLVFASVSKLAFGTLVLNFCILFYYFRKKEKRFFKVIFVFMLVSGVLFGAILIERFQKMADQAERRGTLIRFMLWGSALKGFWEHPLFGNGPGTQSELYQMERHGGIHLADFEKKGLVIPRSPHNSFLSIALQGGLASLSMFFLFVIFYAKSIHKRLKRLRRIRNSLSDEYFHDFFICSLISLMNTLLACMFSGAQSLNILWFLFGLSLAGISTYRLEQKALHSTPAAVLAY